MNYEKFRVFGISCFRDEFIILFFNLTADPRRQTQTVNMGKAFLRLKTLYLKGYLHRTVFCPLNFCDSVHPSSVAPGLSLLPTGYSLPWFCGFVCSARDIKPL